MFDKIILEGAFTSFKECVAHIAPCKLGYLFACACKARWRTIDIISQVKEPIFFVTGDGDKIVPSWMSRQLQCAAVNSMYTELYIMTGAKHGHLWASGDEYWNTINTYLDRDDRSPLPAN